MIAAKAIWTDNERYIGEATSRHAIVMDTATDKSAGTPMELVLIALCGCTASDVVGILRKKREPFTTLEVSASGERASGPPPRGLFRCAWRVRNGRLEIQAPHYPTLQDTERRPS